VVSCIELRNIAKYFDDFKALDGVSFEVMPGECFALLGPSGCGKTTTLRLIAGLEEPDRGEIFINRKKVCGPKNIVSPHQRQVGMVFQDLALWPHMTVKENIAFGLKGKKLKRLDIEETVKDILKTVSLNGQGVLYPHTLSGGERQRVALARAIVTRPEILLFDEPLSSLDPLLKYEIQDLLIKIKQQYNTTLIYVTHDQKEAEVIADRIAVMKDGRIEQIGTKEELYSKPKTEFVKRFMKV
jgi:iron(III) transport system ATP-binding protein